MLAAYALGGSMSEGDELAPMAWNPPYSAGTENLNPFSDISSVGMYTVCDQRGSRALTIQISQLSLYAV